MSLTIGRVKGQRIAAELDRLIKEEVGPDVGFSLMIWELNQAPSSQVVYLSNCDQTSVETALIRVLAKWAEKRLGGTPPTG
jgi:hypothetical protein